jgi:3-deoxy-7-phosphoheptulonate synthase
VTKQGLSAIVETEGNNSTHVILRGSSKGPNYAQEHVIAAGEKLKKAGLPARLMVSDSGTDSDDDSQGYACYVGHVDMEHCGYGVLMGQIDCSHGNSSKQHQKQIEVGRDIVSDSTAVKSRDCSSARC